MTPADRIRAAVAERTWGHLPDTVDAIAAAVCEALADVVVPAEVSLRRGMRPGGTGSIAPDEFKQDQRAETRRRLLAIAAELRGEVERG